jgi:hypothetical protein
LRLRIERHEAAEVVVDVGQRARARNFNHQHRVLFDEPLMELVQPAAVHQEDAVRFRR